MPGRSENAIKNHYYSAARRAVRRKTKDKSFSDKEGKRRKVSPSNSASVAESPASKVINVQKTVSVLVNNDDLADPQVCPSCLDEKE